MSGQNKQTSSDSPGIEAPSRAEAPAPLAESSPDTAQDTARETAGTSKPDDSSSAGAARQTASGDGEASQEQPRASSAQPGESAESTMDQAAKPAESGDDTMKTGSASGTPEEPKVQTATKESGSETKPAPDTETMTREEAAKTGEQSAAPSSDSSMPAQPETPAQTGAQTNAPGTQGSQEQEQQVAVITAPKQPMPSARSAAIPPSFDVVRISQQCTAVIAGRAEPGAQVTVWDGDQPLGQVKADPRGEWVLVVSEPMHSGSRQLKLVAIGAGNTPIESDSVVVIAVPDCTAPGPDTGKESVIAVLTPKEGGTSQVLQAPESEDEGEAAKGLSLKSVDYDEKGEVVLSGKAEPGQNVQAYVDNEPIGAAQADEEGRWEVKPDETIEPGVHKLRVDQVEQGGKVAARIELPFSRASAAQVILAPGHVTVQPGNSLWRIARRTYGHGLRYTVIYQANQDQIRNPDLIYPGQIFSLPRVNTQVN